MSRAHQFKALRDQLGTLTATEPGQGGAPCLRFGIRAVDEALPAGGLAPGSHEVCAGGADLPHEAAAVQLVACLLGRASGLVVWVLPRLTLFPPALAEAGLSADRVVYAEAGRDADVLAVAEEALRHGGLAGVVCEAGRLSLTASRRLQLAAEAGGTPALVVRRWRGAAPPTQGTACATRWQVLARPSSCPSGLPRSAWSLALTRCRGGRPGGWNVALEETDEPGPPLRLRLVEPLVGGQDGPAGRRQAA